MRCVECDESFNRSEVERNRCPHCDAKLPAANAPPRKKMKKGQPQSWFAAKRKWVLALAGGLVGTSVALTVFLLVFDGRPGPNDPLASTWNTTTATVDDLPELAPVPAWEDVPRVPEVAAPNAAPAKPAWQVRPDPAPAKQDYGKAFGAGLLFEEPIRASLNGPFALSRSREADPAKRTINVKSKLPGVPYENAPAKDRPNNVMDLMTGKPVGEFRGQDLTLSDRLAPDGRHLLQMSAKFLNGVPQEYNGDLLVYELGKAQPVLRWKMPDTPYWFGFIGPTKVAVVFANELTRSVVVLEIGKPEPILNVPFPDINGKVPTPIKRAGIQYITPRTVGGAVSPNGSTLAVLEPTHISLLNTTTGTVLERLPLPKTEVFQGCSSITFNESGEQLRAAFYETSTTSGAAQRNLRIWSMTDGRQLFSTRFNFPTLYFDNVADGPVPGTIILGQYLCDLSSGRVIQELNCLPTHWAGPDMMFGRALRDNIEANSRELKESVDYVPRSTICRVPFDRAAFDKAYGTQPTLTEYERPGVSSFDRAGVLSQKAELPAKWEFSPDGANLLSIQSTNAISRDVVLWNLTNGQRSSTPETLPLAASYHWLNGKRLLINGIVYDLDQHCSTYVGKAGMLKSDPLGRTWGAVEIADGIPKAWGAVVASGQDGLPHKVAFGPGSTLKVEVNIGATEANRKLADSTAEHFRKLGFKFGKGAWTLRASHTVGQSEPRFLDPTTQQKTISVTRLTITWELLSPEGTVAFSQKTPVDFDPHSSKFKETNLGANQNRGDGMYVFRMDYGGRDATSAQTEETADLYAMFNSTKPPFQTLRVVETPDGLKVLPLIEPAAGK